MQGTYGLAVITGAASGIGRAIALRLADGGWRILAADRDAAGLARLAQERPSIATAALDVADEAAVEALAAAVRDEHGAADALVTAAGILQDNVPLDAMTLDEHDRIWSVNYRGTFLCCRAFGRAMAERGGGAILTIASITGLRPLPLFAYGPGKAAIVSLTATVAGHLGPRGVRVNSIAPGYVATPPLLARIKGGLRTEAALTAPSALGRLVRPEEIAEAAAFLVGPGASAITGITLPVDAGWLAGSSWGTYGGLAHNAAAADG